MSRDTKHITHAANAMQEAVNFITAKVKVPVTCTLIFSLNQPVERGGPTSVRYEFSITGSQVTTTEGANLDDVIQRAVQRFKG